MLHFSRLKTALIFGVCLIGALLAVPNFIKPGVLPAWVPQPRINLGLDLQGGSYLLLEVDLKTVLKERLVELRSEVVQALVKARVPHGGATVRDQSVSIDLFRSRRGRGAQGSRRRTGRQNSDERAIIHRDGRGPRLEL